MHELAGVRTRAYLIDCGMYLAVVAATVPFGVLAHARGWGKRRAFVLGVSAVPPLVATVIAACQESGPRAATFGKRRQGLVVVRSRDGGPVTFARGLIRNAAKIGIPWQIGHLVAVGAALGYFDDADPLTLGATVFTYPLLGAMVATATTGSGRALHDRLVDTVVQRVAIPL